MRVMMMPRGGGKTTTLLRWLRTHPKALLLTISEQEAVMLRELVPEELQPRIRAATPGCLRGQEGPVAFDNLDVWLRVYLGAPVTVATVTIPEG